uniref:Lysosomal alpha-glucosidase n=1 Tax=Salmo trutta TaxID=8032 RepID=A0A673WCZ7_SALTR
RRFDCARDRVLSQIKCQGRGCCYAPLPQGLSGGPPLVLLPPSYSGYRMGPLTPTSRGQAATLTRPTPSYLPLDISTLRLEILDETEGRLHLTVSLWLYNHSYIYYRDTGFGCHYRRDQKTLWPHPMIPPDRAKQAGYNPTHFVVLHPSPALTWVAVGGILVVRQYLLNILLLSPIPMLLWWVRPLVGYPMMPPYWSLGFHLCRWGYRSTNATREVVRRMHNANFPLVFTFDPQRFVDQPDMLKEFHQKGMKYILILVRERPQPSQHVVHIAPLVTYPPFDEGQRRGVFIRNSTGQTVIRKVRPKTLTSLSGDPLCLCVCVCMQVCVLCGKVCMFGGLWIDMNEPDSFVQGSVEGCPDSDLDSPPLRVVGGQLNTGTLCMSAQQNQSTHYNLHNLYGLTEASATHSALVKVWGSRPFVLSRSSFPGIGRFSGVWTGDVRSDWEQLRYSIPGEGKDIRCCCLACSGCPWWGRMCVGLGGDTTEELCVRWTQLGAFYPFMRNHNDKPNAPQELYVFGLEAQAAMRSAVMLRYSLLPFLYTLFYHTHTSADTVGTPLFLQFPSDPNCQTIDRQFLWGSSLLVSPVLEQGAVELAAYLPPGTWYRLQPFYSKGQYLLLPAPLDTINVHVREGHIIPQQEPGLTTSASRSNPFLLMVALGAGLDTFQRGYYSCVIFIAGQVGDVENGALDGLVLGGLRVFGVPSPPRYVWANGKKVWDFSYRTDTKVSGSWLSYLYRV